MECHRCDLSNDLSDSTVIDFLFDLFLPFIFFRVCAHVPYAIDRPALGATYTRLADTDTSFGSDFGAIRQLQYTVLV